MNTRRLIRFATVCLILAVVLFVVVLLPELPGAIPRSIRKGFACCVVVTITARLTLRLLRRKPTDHPLPADAPSSSTGSFERSIPWLLGLFVLGIAIPLLSSPNGFPVGDWEYFAAKYEAGRISILEYKQFPWWDPWTRGGFPLAGNPLFAVFGVPMPLVLLFGTTVGLRLSIAAYAVLAAEGSRRLARPWLRDPVAAAFVGLIYALNGGSMIGAVASYDVPMGYAVLPWMLYFVFRLDQGPWMGFWLGFWGAFNLLNGIAYFTVYSVAIAGVVWLRVFSTASRMGRIRILINSILALGVALSLAGWRLAVTGLLARDFPRVMGSIYSMPPLHAARMLLGRPSAVELAKPPPAGVWEVLWYVGPFVLAAAAISLVWGRRWWHLLFVVCTLLALGGDAWYLPSYWLDHLPLFSSLYVTTRWRFMATLGLALAAGSTLARLRASDNPKLRLVARLLFLFVAVDYGAYAFEILPLPFSGPEQLADQPKLDHGDFVQINAFRDYGAVRKGYGLPYGYEPILGYDRHSITNRLPRESPRYFGEFRTDAGPVRPEFWSPNRIELRVGPGETLQVNQNPGSWWRVDGAIPPGWDRLRCAETRRDFTVNAGPSGRVVLEIRPKGLDLGVKFHILGVLLCGFIVGTRRFWWCESPDPTDGVNSARSTLPA